MRTDAAVFFQLQSVEQQSQQIEFIIVKSEKRAQAHVVDAGFLGTVHGGQPVYIIFFGAGRMHLFVSFMMIRFLKKQVGADAGFFQTAEFVDLERSKFHIDAADFSAIFRFGGIGRFDGFNEVIQARTRRMLATEH